MGFVPETRGEFVRSVEHREKSKECVARDVPFVHRDVVALRLSPEDAFYLHAVVGCLVVYACRRA